MDKVLEEHVAKGSTRAFIAQAISKQFKVNITKNSVIGRSHRIGAYPLKPRNFAEPIEPPKPPKPKPKPAPVLVKKVVYVPKASEGGCQYLHGEASERNFCDKPRVRLLRQSSGMWCAEHEAKVYMPTPKKSL